MAKVMDVVVAADVNCMANASIDAGSFDPDPGDAITLSQTPAGPYPLGTNVVTLTVTDSHGATNSSSAMVIVIDMTPPQITCPGNITVNSTSPRGAVVTYAPVASDDCSGPAVVTCTPASGSTFPIGTTTVDCLARDQAGNSASCSFQVTVIGPSQTVQGLLGALAAKVGRMQPLSASVNAAIASLLRGNSKAAINELDAFQNKVKAQLNRKDPALAAALIKSAQDIINMLSGGISKAAVQASAHSTGRICTVVRQANGNVHLLLEPGTTMPVLIEASSDLVNWKIIGEGVQQPDGSFCFVDGQAQGLGNRYYRVKP
jgi:hypothetical protein